MNKILMVASCLSLAFPIDLPANPDAGFPKSAEVREDGRVTFRFLGPAEVRSQAVGGKASLAQIGSNTKIWEYTTEAPVEPGIYDYTFAVNGATVLDPHNRWVKGWRRSANLLLVPGDPPRLWEAQAVPHGTIHHHIYHSETLETEREAFVYTPPGYADSAVKLPVLFLFHGSGDDATAWTNVGRAHFIADNLIAKGKMKPMVIVMPHGHARYPQKNLDEIEDRGDWYIQNNAAVYDDFFGTLLPLVAKNYRISEKPGERAIAGLSMGGGQALELGLNRPDEFGWVLGFSSGVPGDAEAASAQFGKLPDPKAFELVWIGCGRDDFLLDRNEFFRKWLGDRGVKHTWKLTDGGHSWPVWRDYLAETLPLLFQN